MTYNQKALKQYQTVNVHSAVDGASPHKLISLLLEGLVTALIRAKGVIEQKNLTMKIEQINKASGIVMHLQASLDHEKGGEVSANLDALYDYMLRRIMLANSTNDIEIIDEVIGLANEVKAGWEEMPEQ